MRDKLIAKRYAEAYIEFAADRIGLDVCVAEMKSLKWLLRENPDLVGFLHAPEVSRADKMRVLENVFKTSFSEETIIFIKYLMTKGRLGQLLDIADYVRVHYGHGESQAVVLRTTFPLALELVQAIKTRLEARLKSKTNLYLELDPDLLGGIQVVIGNTIIDGSVRNRINILR